MLSLVLSGGAARGAYEAGVLRYLFCDLAKQVRLPWPRIVSGTSVGALNGVFVAARDPAGLERLCRTWQTLSVRDVFRLRTLDALRAMKSTFLPTGAFALLDARPLARLVHRQFPAQQLRRRIDQGDTVAFIVTATRLANGYNTLFVDSRSEIDFRVLPGNEAFATQIGARHTLASAALPFLFPPVPIDGRLFVDGGLRLNTPLRPVLKAGATRALVIGLKTADPTELGDSLTPNLPFLLGKTLNALLLDPVERDSRHLAQLNRVVEWGVAQYGPGFAERLKDDLGILHVEVHRLQPSEDLGSVAATLYRSAKLPLERGARRLLDLVADRANTAEADLLSYLFFDAAYTGEIEQLGYEDAKRDEESLVRLFVETEGQ